MKNVIITGTSRGIGFELAQLFADADHNVLAISRNTKTISRLNRPKITTLSIDISDEKDINKVVDFVASNWKNVDIIIHNAGMLVNKPFTEITQKEYLRSV